jgi:hypothetical protein
MCFCNNGFRAACHPLEYRTDTRQLGRLVRSDALRGKGLLKRAYQPVVVLSPLAREGRGFRGL